MKLEIEDKLKVYQELVLQLEQNGFKVSYDKRYGTIRRAGKSNIWCYPALNDSTREGKQGYTFLTLELGGYDQEQKNKDLGYWLTQFNLQSLCFAKYGNQNTLPSLWLGVLPSATSYVKPVAIDTHNMEGIVKDFVSLLSKDYENVLSRKKPLNSSLKEDMKEPIIDEPLEDTTIEDEMVGQRVTIQGTNDFFEGKNGTIKEEIDDKALVLVNIGNNNLVAQIISKENLTII